MSLVMVAGLHKYRRAFANIEANRYGHTHNIEPEREREREGIEVNEKRDQSCKIVV